jgi:hypothetical protein
LAIKEEMITCEENEEISLDIYISDVTMDDLIKMNIDLIEEIEGRTSNCFWLF